MKFHTGKRPFRGESPLTYNAVNESESLLDLVREHNEANEGRGLKFLRSFLSNIVGHPELGLPAKRIYAAVNSAAPSSSVSIARELLTQSYESAREHLAHVQVACLVKKFPFDGSAEERRENAYRKFLRGERRNRHFNALLRRRRVHHDDVCKDGSFTGSFDPSVPLRHMRQYIRRIIGNQPRFKELNEHARWGPGAVVGVNGQFTHFARKLLAEEWTITPAAVPYALSTLKRFPMFWELLGMVKTFHDESGETVNSVYCVDPDEFDQRLLARLKVVQYNKIAFVPKDADCDRTIASEPLINQFLQLAVDGWMKKRLRKAGLDLSNQRLNQIMAREGSKLDGYNPYCTADLKNASGSIYTELVRELLPGDWFIFLNSIRSPSWKMDKGSAVKYHGFVSMGNGYCFPLETLIFASICYAAHVYTGTDPDFRVYGDDIIVRQNESGVLQEYLRYFGFELNPEKSFFFGPFRESCGADWYDGAPVRPVYLDDSLDTFEQRVRAHNAFARSQGVFSEPLAHACRNWFPDWTSKFVRPFAGATDEAVDNRYATFPDHSRLWCKTLQCPAWYGISFRSVKDTEVAQVVGYPTALRYAALQGSTSDSPFAMRRETRMSVKRFYHGGGESQDLPFEAASVRPKWCYPHTQHDAHVRSRRLWWLNLWDSALVGARALH